MSVRITRQHPAIGWHGQAEDGPLFGYDNAKIQCSRCEGFTGLECPQEGCTVRLVSTQAEDDEAFRRKMAEEETERRRYRAERRAAREARG